MAGAGQLDGLATHPMRQRFLDLPQYVRAVAWHDARAGLQFGTPYRPLN
jgi:hypothetical protein